MNQREFMRSLFEQARGTVHMKNSVTGKRQLNELAIMPRERGLVMYLANRLKAAIAQDNELTPEMRTQFLQSVETINDYYGDRDRPSFPRRWAIPLA